jgi:putative DNA methylase
MRERGASSALPPLYFLHVWWARRPLLTSRAAILASVLPTWSESWPAKLREKFPTCESYHSWFIVVLTADFPLSELSTADHLGFV